MEKKLYKSLNQESLRSDSNSEVNPYHKSGLNQDFHDLLENITQQEVMKSNLIGDKSTIFRIRQNALHKISKQLKKEQRNEIIANDNIGGVHKEQKDSLLKSLKSLIQNKAFVTLCLSLTGLYFVVTGVQYWTADYLKNVIKMDDHSASIYFSTTSLTAPIGGVFVGGVMTTAFGGYNNPKAMKL